MPIVYSDFCGSIDCLYLWPKKKQRTRDFRGKFMFSKRVFWMDSYMRYLYFRTAIDLSRCRSVHCFWEVVECTQFSAFDCAPRVWNWYFSSLSWWKRCLSTSANTVCRAYRRIGSKRLDCGSSLEFLVSNGIIITRLFYQVGFSFLTKHVRS